MVELLPPLSPLNGVESRDVGLRPFESQMPRDFLEAIGICRKIDLSKNEGQQVDRRIDGLRGRGVFRRWAVVLTEPLEKSTLVTPVMDQHGFVSGRKQVEELCPDPRLLRGIIGP